MPTSEQIEKAARRGFPVLSSQGQKIDWQLVADHGEQARKNHYQTVDQLASRGGLAWCELHAVLHNKDHERMDENKAILECRALEAQYLAALSAAEVKPRVKPLEWREHWSGEYDNIPTWRGDNPLGLHVGISFAGKYKLINHSDAPAEELAERKAAAQANYEARILSALEGE